jgi:hypothetical protein
MSKDENGEKSAERRKKPPRLKSDLEHMLSAVHQEANMLIPLNEQLLREALDETRELYLYATKQKDEGSANNRYLLARLSALYSFLEVMYPQQVEASTRPQES